MATMQFRVSQDEFARIVKTLQQGTIDTSETDEEKVEEIVDFFQVFMVDMENECILELHNYELVVDKETIQLDIHKSDGRLKELVRAVMVPWESVRF